MQRKLTILLAFLVAWLLMFAITTHAEGPELALRDQPIGSIVTYFSNKNGISPRLALKVMECESGGIQDTTSDMGLSHGIFQIQKSTWDRFTGEMGEKLDYDSPMDQAKVATWAMAHGHATEWSTFIAIMKGGKYSFYSRQLHRHFTVICKA